MYFWLKEIQFPYQNVTFAPTDNVNRVKPKKHLGQHFLNSEAIAGDIAALVPDSSERVLEVGPGTGMLTRYLAGRFPERLWCVELDKESVQWLQAVSYRSNFQLLEADMLHADLGPILGNTGHAAVVGNFPYNISSQIVFRVLEHRGQVFWFGGMFQREVARRLCSPPGSKEYGILSVLLQAYYQCQYQFTVHEGSFTPPPKVKSGVIACVRKETDVPACTWESLKLVVKTAFNQRRKTLSNALKPLALDLPVELSRLRAEQLGWKEFETLALQLDTIKTR